VLATTIVPISHFPGLGAARMDPAIHTHVFGRPTGMAIFQRIMEIAKAADDVWVGTRSQAVTHVRSVLKT
ncbi:MAG: hypothetical protein ABI547_05150, partial [Betaproteobacteria bacterium]